MNRRTAIATLGTGGLATLTGCAALASVTSGGRKIGEPSTHKGVKFTPKRYLLTDQLSRQSGNNNHRMTAESGAVFLLTHLKVSHEGDSAQAFPQTLMTDSIEAFYDGERVSDGGAIDKGADRYVVEGKTLTTYYHALQQADATGEVYPGTKADGWVFNKLASNFDPSKLKLRVTWNKKIIGSEGETTHEWTYTEKAEVSIDEIENDDDGSTIRI